MRECESFDAEICTLLATATAGKWDLAKRVKVMRGVIEKYDEGRQLTPLEFELGSLVQYG